MSKRRSAGIGITLYKKPRSPNWWADLHVDGKRFRRSTGQRDRRLAEARARELQAELTAELQAPDDAGDAPPDDDLALLAGLDVAEAVARGVGERQLHSIRSCWSHVCRILGPETPPSAVTYDLVVGHLAKRRGEGARGQSIVKEVQALKRGLRIARRRGSLAAIPEEWPKVRRDPADTRKRGKLHEVAVLSAWLARLEELSPPARRQAEVALRTGLRAEELRALSWSWVESAPEEAGVPAVLRVPAAAAKTRRERVLGLTPETLVVLHEAREAVSGWDVPLFVGNHRGTFRRACKDLEYPQHITLRDLRHCHATWAAQGTGDAAAAQAALGHTDLRTTQRYLSATLARTASAAVAVGDMLGTVPSLPAPGSGG